MPTKGQMKLKSRLILTASQAGENRQTNGSEHAIVYSILTDLIFKKIPKKSNIVGPTIVPAKHPSSSNEFQNYKLTQISSSTPTLILILDSYKSETQNVSNPLNLLIKNEIQNPFG
jgi:hypothetical protein